MKFSKFLLVISLLSATLVQHTTIVTAQDQPIYPTYIVESGDTLSLIAAKFGISLTQLIDVNQITDPNSITIGVSLKIPGYEGISGTLKLKTAALLDSLSSLSKMNQISPKLLINLNRITTPQEVYVGSELIVPEAPSVQDKVFSPLVRAQNNSTLFETAATAGSNIYELTIFNYLENSWQDLPWSSVYTSKNNSASLSHPSVIKEILIQPLPVQQGSTFSISISATEPLTVAGSYNGKQLPFTGINENEYIALVGINAQDSPGLHPISLSAELNGRMILELEQFLLINAGVFGETLQLTVDPETIDPTIIAEEDSVVDSILANFTNQKYWDGKFNYPLDDACVRAYYGGPRIYNNSYTYYHTGVDFGICANNLNIYAPADGVVVLTTKLPIRGNTTIIDHGLGIFSGYFHQDSILVSTGDRVTSGQLIGIIGNTGRSTGAHLHWEIWVNSESVNPLSWAERGYP